MDIITGLCLCAMFVILFSLCGWFCKRTRSGGAVLGYGPTVTVTTTQAHHVPSPQVVPPYPIDARHPTPGSHAPAPGFTTHHQAPYPTHTPNMPFPQGQTPYPPTGPAPYPPASYPPATNDYSANPPPYDVAVAQPPIQPPQSKDGYVKQSPYNPGYN